SFLHRSPLLPPTPLSALPLLFPNPHPSALSTATACSPAPRFPLYSHTSPSPPRLSSLPPATRSTRAPRSPAATASPTHRTSTARSRSPSTSLLPLRTPHPSTPPPG